MEFYEYEKELQERVSIEQSRPQIKLNPKKQKTYGIATLIHKLNPVKIIKNVQPEIKVQNIHLNFELDGGDILNLALILFFLTLARVGPKFLQGQNFTNAFRFKILLVFSKFKLNSRVMNGNTLTTF
jgi:hypothetical protein